ncbi:glycosyltransferase family 4 protein [Crocosphaera sp.]|uniref:glycosyltransferase family 4 protein n=1 Tax=Crocosphaera sp. TaxID=2729996 RepID=UPI003F276707
MSNYTFVFLEIFSQEGGIQAYVKDVLKAYLSLIEKSSTAPKTDIFLLRDAPDCHNPLTSELINYYYLKTLPPWKGRLKLALKLLTHLVTNRPKRVFCGHINLAPLVQFLCHPLGIPYTVLTYGKEVWKPLAKAQQTALKNADAIWTISRYSRDCLCQANDINLNKVEIVPCIVDGEQFTPGEKPSELIEKYNLQGAKVLMTVARLWSGDIYKGVDVTIRALPKILQSFPNVKYVVIGRGDDRPRLEQLTKDLGISERVVFAGFVPSEDLVNHYRLADAYIMPSQEGFGIVYLEAMACGVPVLSGDADGSADPLQDGQLGWRVPHRDPQAVAQGCNEILQGNGQRCQRQWLRQQTLDKFSPDALSQKLAQLI